MPTKKKCKCDSCKQIAKIKRFEKTLTDKQLKVFSPLIKDIWMKMEVAEMDRDVLYAKIEGTWPKEDNENYYERVNGQIYIITSTKVEKTPTTNK